VFSLKNKRVTHRLGVGISLFPGRRPKSKDYVELTLVI
jgi:hypothetical protein